MTVQKSGKQPVSSCFLRPVSAFHAKKKEKSSSYWQATFFSSANLSGKDDFYSHLVRLSRRPRSRSDEISYPWRDRIRQVP
jgi:hypothetical protein